MSKQFIDGPFSPILLKIKKFFPNLGLEQTRLPQVGIGLPRVAEEFLEDVVQRFVIDEFW